MSLRTVDLQTLRRELDPTGRGHEAGRQGLPPPGATYDPHERRITDEIEGHLQDACNDLADQRNEALAHLAELGAGGFKGDMHASVQKALGRLEHVATSAGMDLEHARQASEERKRDFFRFRQDHRLSGREPDYPDSGGRWLRVGVVMLLFVIESIANSVFLAKGNELGVLGAYVVAFGISALNLLSAALFFGRISCFLGHVRPALRIVAGSLMVLYAAFAVILNLGVAHYREVSGGLTGEAGFAVVARMRENPLGLQDAESWLLFGLGLLFSVIAFVEGRTYDDPYPGYGRRHRSWQEFQDAFSAAVDDVQEELSDVLDESLDEVKRVAHEARRRPDEIRRLADGWRRRLGEFDRQLAHLQQVGDVLIAEYREANREARPDHVAPPVHGLPWRLSSHDIDRGDLPGIDRISPDEDELQKIDDEYRRATDLIHERFKAMRDHVVTNAFGVASSER